MKNINKIILAAFAVSFFSCSDDFDNPVEDFVVTSGKADFTKYVALGNSLTSGYMDGALYKTGQENSYPSILAGLMKPAGGGEFTQPLMPDDIGGFANFGIKGKLQLQVVDGSLVPVATDAQSNFSQLSGPFSNMGVPGAKSFHLGVDGYGNPAGIASGKANPYFARFASSATTSVIKDAVAQQPTFFSLWIGNNDVLSYATGGGVGVDRTGNPNAAEYGPDDITDPGLLGNVIESYVKALTADGTNSTKGVIANIPSVTSVPYFTTVPYAPLSPANPSFGPMIPSLNQQFGALNMVFDYLKVPERKIVFSMTSASPVLIKDEDLPNLAAEITAVLTPQVGAQQAALFGLIYGQARQATAQDLLVLPASSYIGKMDPARVEQLKQMGVPEQQAAQLAFAGITYPLEDKWVLTKEELQTVEKAVSAYNTKIAEIATKYDLALVDANTEMRNISVSGLTFYGTTYTTNFIAGGAFSLDGVHLTGSGYAIVANMFVRAINQKYLSNLRQVNPSVYPGVTFPN